MSLIVASAHKHNITVGICGELANHPDATSILVGLGIDELSVSPSVLLEIKQMILNINYKESFDYVNDIIKIDKLFSNMM